jgi:hypothetical protein
MQSLDLGNIDHFSRVVHNVPDSRLPDTKSFQIEWARHNQPTAANQLNNWSERSALGVFSKVGYCLLRGWGRCLKVTLQTRGLENFR